MRSVEGRRRRVEVRERARKSQRREGRDVPAALRVGHVREPPEARGGRDAHAREPRLTRVERAREHHRARHRTHLRDDPRRARAVRDARDDDRRPTRARAVDEPLPVARGVAPLQKRERSHHACLDGVRGRDVHEGVVIDAVEGFEPTPRDVCAAVADAVVRHVAGPEHMKAPRREETLVFVRAARRRGARAVEVHHQHVPRGDARVEVGGLGADHTVQSLPSTSSSPSRVRMSRRISSGERGSGVTAHTRSLRSW